MVERLYKKRAIAEIADVHEQTIPRWVREGRFPKPIRTGKVGSAVRWRESDIVAWIAERASREGDA